MSFKEITLLRKSGKLDEAYQMALSDLHENPNDIWNKRAMSWVIYAYLKQSVERNDTSAFFDYITKIAALELSAEENVFFDSVAWQCGKIVSGLHEGVDVFCNKLFEQIKCFHFTRPSDSYSYLLHSFHRHRKVWNKYLEFCDWWNFDNFMPRDYEKSNFNGKDIMSLAEQVYIGYAKILQQSLDEEKKLIFIDRLSNIIETHPEYQYPLYYKAKLLLSLNKKKDIFKLLLPFVRSKQNDFWVWQILGDACNDSEIQFSCYSKALTCRCKDEMLVSIKERYACMLIDRNMYSEAKREIEQLVSIRKCNEWRLSDYVCHIVNEVWYKETPISTSKNIYQENAVKAEKILYSDFKSISVVITNVNKDKDIVNFITYSLKHGYFYYSKFFKTFPVIGDKFDIKFFDFNNNKPCHVATIDACVDINKFKDILKSVSGKVIADKDRRFGIVRYNNEMAFINRQLLSGLENGDSVRGEVVKSYDKKHARWGWSFISIVKSN